MKLDDLENIMRKQANKAHKQPEDDLWERIGQQMKRPSERRKNHFYLSYLVAAILVGLLAIPVYLMLKTDFFSPIENPMEPPMVHEEETVDFGESESYVEQEKPETSLNKSKDKHYPKESYGIEEKPIAIHHYKKDEIGNDLPIDLMELDDSPITRKEAMELVSEKAEQEEVYALQEASKKMELFESPMRMGNAAISPIGYGDIALNTAQVNFNKINEKEFQYQDETGTYQFVVTPIKNGKEIILTTTLSNQQGFFNLNTSTGRMDLQTSDSTNLNLQLIRMNLQRNQQWIQDNFPQKIETDTLKSKSNN